MMRKVRARIMKELNSGLGTKIRHHIGYLATVCISDMLIDQRLFGNGMASTHDSIIKMAKDIYDAMGGARQRTR